MQIFRSEAAVRRPLEGFERRTLATGASMMVVEWTMEAGAAMPTHQHPHEQVGYLLEGDVTMVVDGREYRLAPGDSYIVPPNVAHAGRIHAPSVMIDIFSPPRDDYRG
jgi:quercetin dioxygenase-like cupin family protein